MAKQSLKFQVKLILVTALFALLFLLFTGGALADSNKPASSFQVLVVHSSYQGYPWTDSMHFGIHEGFKSAPEKIEFWTEYIDTKRNLNKDYFKRLHELFKTKYQGKQIDLIIAVDNEAYDFVMEDRESLFNGIPLVFAGYIGFTPELIVDKPFITGVIQENSFEETIDLALLLHPKTQKIVFVLPDAWPVRVAWVAHLPDKYRGRVDVVNITANTLELIDSELAALGPDIVVIPLNSFQLESGNYLPFDEFISHLSSKETYPVYGLWDIALGHGIVGGKLVSGKLQGQEAARLALQILRGTSVSDIPVTIKSPNQYMFDWRQLQRFGLDVPKTKEMSFILNTPRSFYQENKTIVWAVCITFLGYTILVVGLWVVTLRRKQAEKELQKSKKHLQNIIAHLPSPIIITDIKGDIEFFNDKFIEVFGYTIDDISTSEQWWTTVYPDPDHRALVQQTWDSAITDAANKRTPIETQMWDVTCKDRSVRWVEINMMPLDEISVIAMNDITERKKAEDKLRNERFRLSEIIRGTNVGTWEWNVQTNELKTNQRWAEIIGYNLKELAPISQETWTKNLHPDDLKTNAALLEKHFNGAFNHYEIECRLKHKDGHWIWVMSRGRVSSWTTDDKPLLMYGTLADISAHKRAEEERQKAQKLTSIGTLAGGIAHDFNNILAGLYGNISLGKAELRKALPDHPGFSYLEAAEKSMNRATALTNQLLTFSKGGDPIKETLALSVFIEDVVPFNLSGSNVKPVISAPDNLWFVSGDKGQLQQVLANLTINAIQAMPEGGQLEVTLENIEIPDNCHMDLAGGKYIKMTLTDSGIGIKPEHIEHIFDPYFTTKHAGSGLGLATVYSIIKKHAGYISVTSHLGQGTCFTLYLPAAKEQSLPPATNTKTIAISPSQQAARILVMDDDEMICSIVKALLSESGYEVEVVHDGTLALERYRQTLETETPFDLVILDLTIPGGVGGKEVIKQMLLIDPQAKVIVSSGYADDPVMANYADYGFKGVAAKPYELDTLLGILDKVLTKGLL